jgi:hypothetical protein
VKPIALSFVAALLVGCGTPLKVMTATAWVEPPGAPAGTPAAGAPPAEAAPAAPAAALGLSSHYYVSYWQGSCRPFLGCGAGVTAVRRCRVEADNSATCADEPDMARALNAE